MAGDQRRAALVTAGLELLAETGWVGVTQRAVAERAGANAGLVHYYFAGSDGLRLAITDEACRRQIGGLVDRLGDAADIAELLTRVEAEFDREHDPDQTAVLASVADIATTDARFGEVVSTHLRAARSAVAAWLVERDRSLTADAAASGAVTLVALIDGLALHRAMDRDVRAAGLAASLSLFATAGAA